MSDQQAVIDANRAFYTAFQSLDLETMEKIWLRDSKIVCIHPGWRALTGWGPVMNSWERIFDGTFEMKFQVREVQVMMEAGLAVVVTEENLTQRGYDGAISTQVLATNVYQLASQKWWLIQHHGSPVVRPAGQDTPLQ